MLHGMNIPMRDILKACQHALYIIIDKYNWVPMQLWQHGNYNKAYYP